MFWKKAKSNAHGINGPVLPRYLDNSSYKLYVDGNLKYSEWKSIAERQLEESKGNWSYSDYSRLILNERRTADWFHDISKTVILASCISVLLTNFASDLKDSSLWEMIFMCLSLGVIIVTIVVCLLEFVFRARAKRVFFYDDLLEILDEKAKQTDNGTLPTESKSTSGVNSTSTN